MDQKKLEFVVIYHILRVWERFLTRVRITRRIPLIRIFTDQLHDISPPALPHPPLTLYRAPNLNTTHVDYN